MEFSTKAKDEAPAGDDDDGSQHRILGVGVGVFVIAFFLLLTIVCCVGASACRRGACCMRFCSSLMLVVVLLVLYIASQQPEAPSDTEGYDENIHKQIVITVLTMLATVAALFCVCGSYVVTPIKGSHMHDALATTYAR